ncbi:hypothetical protein D3C81_1843300 [compost metagenome]
MREIFHVLPAGVAAVQHAGRADRVVGRVQHRAVGGSRGGVAVVRLAVSRQAGEFEVGRKAVGDARGDRVHVGIQEVAVLRIDRHTRGGAAVGHRAHEVAAQVGMLVLGAQAIVVQRDGQVLVQLP